MQYSDSVIPLYALRNDTNRLNSTSLFSQCFRRAKKEALTFARKCLIFSVGHLGLDCEADEGLEPE